MSAIYMFIFVPISTTPLLDGVACTHAPMASIVLDNASESAVKGNVFSSISGVFLVIARYSSRKLLSTSAPADSGWATVAAVAVVSVVAVVVVVEGIDLPGSCCASESPNDFPGRPL